MARLLTDFETALPCLSKAVFSQPIDKTDDQKVNIRPVLLRGETRYQLERFRDNKAFHQNLTGEDLLNTFVGHQKRGSLSVRAKCRICVDIGYRKETNARCDQSVAVDLRRRKPHLEAVVRDLQNIRL